jgi:CheY-like chemotaxis protein
MMVTGSTEMAVRRRAEEVGVTELLIKPFKAAEFTALLSQLLRADVG